jgi:hypothetical protein
VHVHRSSTLFHVSEEAGIARFEPKSIDGVAEPRVWAIDDNHLRNYLVPRDCPRVTYSARMNTASTDVERFLGRRPAVLAIEEFWLERLRSARLFCYELPVESFELEDASAGYFVSRVAVTPTLVRIIDDCAAALLERGVELRVVSNLWSLHDAVRASSLEFSMIRMRNASPRLA